MTKNKIIELLKSGNFTIAYHDSDCCYLYKGKMTYDQLSEKNAKEINFDGMSDGYIPIEVEYLVEALGGKVDSI